MLGLAAGCGQEPPVPRELPFPVIETAAPFPELAVPAAPAAGPAQESAPRSTFEAALTATPPPDPAATPQPPAAPAGLSVPLGGQLLGELPPDGSWRWSAEGGAVLAVHASGGTRPTALIYAETFTDLVRDRPSEEHQRFRVTVDPAAAEGHLPTGEPLRRVAQRTGLSGTEAARFLQLVTTRTGGRGLGFRPAPESFTGWRWVGRNEHGVTLRLARQSGSWAEPPSLPARFAEALARLNGSHGAAPGASSGGAAGAVPAYLILGSVTDRYEETGVHLAVLCARSPACAEARDLAAFLASIQPAEAGRLERLAAAPSAGFADLARELGVEILPADQVPTREGLTAGGQSPPAGAAR
ncbi:MAG TPA: hypothetical protein VEL74_05465 [Thermoanaerobaculia bacterium]|nr:hypothetical protein [Thermoanaerobaculia bacterium]